MLKRQGIALDRSTLSTWVGRACWWLTPLYELVLGTVLSSDKAFADETTLPVLDPGRGKTKTGRLWCYAVDDRPGLVQLIRQRPIVYPRIAGASTRWRTWRRSAAPCRWMAMPGSATWSKRARMRRSSWLSVGLMRDDRSTSSTAPPNHRSPLKCLQRIAKLYEIEGDIRGQPPDVRQAVRQLRSRPLVEDLHLWLQDHLPRVPGWTDLAKAMRYALRPLGRPDPVSRRWAPGDGHEHRRACHSSGDHYEEELIVRGCRRWRVILLIWRCPYKVSEFCRGS